MRKQLLFCFVQDGGLLTKYTQRLYILQIVPCCPNKFSFIYLLKCKLGGKLLSVVFNDIK